MNERTAFTFLLLCYAGLSLCFPVTPSAGVNQSEQLFFCETPGCVSNVIYIFCNNKLLLSHPRIPDCTGPPPPNTVCQHDGRAFFSTSTAGECEFEDHMTYIETKKCTDHSNICAFISATTSSQVTTEGTPVDRAKREHIASGVVCGSLLLIGVSCLIANLCKKEQSGEENEPPASDSGVDVPLREMQSPGEIIESDTRDGIGLDDGSSLQRDRGA